jgi:beta-carotene 3-hydroxylase
MEILLAVVAFMLMEPIAALVHRLIMHGVAWVIHASHHRPREGAFEANDLFPLLFAAPTVALFWLGRHDPAAIAVAVGITVYGAAYSFVHDGYIHERFGRLPRNRVLEYLKRAHAIHHLYNEGPYGMLLPVVPRKHRSKLALEVVRSWHPSVARAA